MKISVLFVEYASMEALAAAMEMVAAQTVDAELEKIICDPQKKLGSEQLEDFCRDHQATVCADPQDPLGILHATGEYIAFSKNGYRWTSKEKLAKQIACMEKLPECAMVIHDVEVVKENGNPVDQSVRNRYIRHVGFEERVYQYDNLERFDRCGFSGTWLLRNVFLKEKERELYQKYDLDHAILIPALMIANGRCENLHDDRMVACQIDKKLDRSVEYPVYDMAQVEEKVREVETVGDMMEEAYDVKLDDGYRRLHIANGAFNYFAEGAQTEQRVNDFLSVFDMAYRKEYRRLKPLTPTKNFFYFLRDKIRRFIAEKGTVASLPLLRCIEGTPDYKWIYAIRDCKNKEVREALVTHFEKSNKKARKLVAEDKKKTNPVRVFAEKVQRKLKKIFKRVLGIGKRLILWRMRKMGYSDYMSREWYNTVVEDFRKDKESTLKHKLWCYRRGFTPWRVKQYGIDENTFRTLPSDRDYMYLHQINNSYKKWIEDKMTFRLVLDPFKEHLPKYYFQILQRDDRQLIVKLPDLPEDYRPTLDDLFRLLRQEGKLALKAAAGTHGVGFYKMEYRDGKYYLNNEAMSEEKVRNTINGFKNFYIVTDYIKQHEQISAIYGGSVNTIRIMMINRDGHHPELMDAYMRIGSKKSGVTDNVAFGGVVCTVNMQTGEYGNGMRLKDHVYIPIECHPDTNTPLNGVIPNWEEIKKGVIDICSYMPQLEYLGFDVVCTPEGFTVLEINSHQDLHRLPYYDQRVRDFLFYKLARKERRYHIHRKYR